MSSSSNTNELNVQQCSEKDQSNESVMIQQEPKISGGSTNFPAMLLNRNKKPLSVKNMMQSSSQSHVPSTPANIKRLQVNKWFNSPTDNMFSPCSKKLYKKDTIPSIATCNLSEELNQESNNQENHTQD